MDEYDFLGAHAAVFLGEKLLVILPIFPAQIVGIFPVAHATGMKPRSKLYHVRFMRRLG